MRINEPFTAGQVKAYYARGDFFRLESASLVNVDFYRGGKLLAENLRSASSGYYANPEGGFDEVRVTAPGAQTVVLDVYQGRVGADRVTGAVALTNGPTGAHTPAAKAITNTSAQILAANAGRKYVLIQNSHASLSLWVRCDGAAATADAACLEIPAGGVWEPGFIPTGEISGIRSSASAGNNVHVIEG